MSKATKRLLLQPVQRRIRHVVSLFGRNLTSPTGGLISCCFSLHSSLESPAFYQSEIIDHTLSPTWRIINQKHFTSQVDTSSQHLIVRIWGLCGEQEIRHLLVEVDVFLPSLVFVGKELGVGPQVQLPPDSVLFHLKEGTFCLPDDTTFCAVVPRELSVEVPQAKNSSSLSSIQKLKQQSLGLSQKRQEINALLLKIEEKTALAKEHATLLRQKSELQARIERCRRVLANKQELKEKAATTLSTVQQAHEKHHDSLRDSWRSLLVASERLIEMDTQHREREEFLQRANMLVRIRQSRLVVELIALYTIKIVNANSCSILGIEIPNGDIVSVDDEDCAAALGFICHLLIMMAKYLEIPLRFPIKFLGSRSSIKDEIALSIAERDKDLPLHSKSKNVAQFRLATSLLNKNIQQLLNVCGFTKEDITHPLLNIRTLCRWFAQQHEVLRTELANSFSNEPVLASPTTTTTSPPTEAVPQQLQQPQFPFAKSISSSNFARPASNFNSSFVGGVAESVTSASSLSHK